MNPIYIFDIDGVITNPDTKKPNTKVISFIAEQLNNGYFVAIATGRSAPWVLRRIVSLIKEKLVSKINLQKLFISCEKGGIILTFHNGATPIVTKALAFTVPRPLQEIIKDYVKNADGIFYDKEKSTMISVEIEGGSSTNKLTAQKNALDNLTKWVQAEIMPHYPDLFLERTQISMDIQSKYTSKRDSIKELLKFLPDGKFIQKLFVAFGDNPSDVHLAEELQKNGFKTTFAYVGEKSLEEDYTFPVVYPKNSLRYDRAVVEMLKELHSSKW